MWQDGWSMRLVDQKDFYFPETHSMSWFPSMDRHFGTGFCHVLYTLYIYVEDEPLVKA